MKNLQVVEVSGTHQDAYFECGWIRLRRVSSFVNSTGAVFSVWEWRLEEWLCTVTRRRKLIHVRCGPAEGLLGY